MLKNVGQVVLLSELCQKHHKEKVDYLGFIFENVQSIHYIIHYKM